MKRGFALSRFALLLLWAGCSHSTPRKPAPVRLAEGGWDVYNRNRLETLLDAFGKSGPSYDTLRPPYVVFDWDNTTIFLDIEEAVLAYQLQNLVFRASPEELDRAIRMNIPAGDFAEAHDNTAGEPVNIDRVATDIGRFSKLAAEGHGTREARYLLQGRDDDAGRFVNSQLHFKFGSGEGELLAK